MRDQHISVRYFDVVLSVSRALDLLSSAFSDHHHRVAYASARIGEALGLPRQSVCDLAVAGALHDAGAISMLTRLSLLNYSLTTYHSGAQSGESVHQHGFDGAVLLQDFAPFASAAHAIRYHHVDWEHGRGREFAGEEVPLASHILHLADRVSVVPEEGGSILAQSDAIRALVAEGAGSLYTPELVDAFLDVSVPEAFWLDLVCPYKEEVLRPYFGAQEVDLASDALYELARLFGRLIDYRSPFTATHSANVAQVAETLAELLGISQEERRLIGVAGYLHDLGKLAVPAEILDKPNALSAREVHLVRQHPYYTYRILSMIPGFEDIGIYAAMHHERLDGTGYPFHRRDVPLGARLVAVADVFSALSEDRPYRAGMNWDDSLTILDQMAVSGALDSDVVGLVRDNRDRFGRYVMPG
jgi:HD-GYP domain-containing protein (c-di-GMP phosphodiesterase class II)